MATQDFSDQYQPIMGGTWGNTCHENFRFKPAVDVPISDVVRIVRLQKGTILHDGVLYIAANLASGTVSVGIDYIDTVDSDGVALTDDPIFFFSVQTTAAAGMFRKSTNKPPLELKADAYLVFTFAGAIFPATNELNFDLEYNFLGQR